MRYKLMTILDTTDDKIIYDPLSIDWSTYDWTTGFYKHIISKFEIYKPYMISYAYFQTVEYEDAILLLNHIENIFEIEPGTEIKIPLLDPLQKFIRANRK